MMKKPLMPLLSATILLLATLTATAAPAIPGDTVHIKGPPNPLTWVNKDKGLA